MSGHDQGAHIVAEARRWLGTPYQHQASLRGVGTDCLGLVRGIWRALYGVEAEAVPPYSPGWAEAGPGAGLGAGPGAGPRAGTVAGKGETLLHAAQRHLVQIEGADLQAGDVLLFRPRMDGPVRHCAIASQTGWIIHAYWGRAVAETALTRWWRRRHVASFRFPEIEC